jgi:hypothetical protein
MMRTEFLRFNGAVERDPAIDAWMKEHAGVLAWGGGGLSVMATFRQSRLDSPLASAIIPCLGKVNQRTYECTA